ncbi:MAG TPA: GSU2403 family nucleotidyltransferase fold protein, partial [Steroidobacteraceae bacterium]
VAVDRVNQAKSAKDIRQAEILIEALAAKRPVELAEAWKTASAAGRQWRKKLQAGQARLAPEAQAMLMDTVKRSERR